MKKTVSIIFVALCIVMIVLGSFFILNIVRNQVILQNTEMKLYSWNEWNVPEYHERLKPSYYILKEAFGRIRLK